jgi:hypothetical protein
MTGYEYDDFDYEPLTWKEKLAVSAILLTSFSLIIGGIAATVWWLLL